MKLLVLTVLLSVMQATPPVPRKTPDNPTQTTANIKTQSKPRKTPPLPSPAPTETSGNRPTEPDGSEDGQKYTEHPIVISKLPAVALATPKRDWADWGTWVFNLFLVGVGGLQVGLLYYTLKTIRRQRDWMKRQTIILVEYNKATREMADAASQNIDLYISKERARLRVVMDDLILPSTDEEHLRVHYRVMHFGPADAVITDSATKAVVTGDEEYPADSEIIGTGPEMQIIKHSQGQIKGSQTVWTEPDFMPPK
jgi:hypothetical protein